MKEESMVGGKQNYHHLYSDVAGIRRCSLYQGLSGLSDPKTFVIPCEMHSDCPWGGDNCRLLHRAKHLTAMGHRASGSKAHVPVGEMAPRKKAVRESELPFKNPPG